VVKNWLLSLPRASVRTLAPNLTRAPPSARRCVSSTRRAPRSTGGEGAAGMPYLFRSPSMTSQASSASASVLKGEPPIVMALVF
jgi:hypothetical protein